MYSVPRTLGIVVSSSEAHLMRAGIPRKVGLARSLQVPTEKPIPNASDWYSLPVLIRSTQPTLRKVRDIEAAGLPAVRH